MNTRNSMLAVILALGLSACAIADDRDGGGVFDHMLDGTDRSLMDDALQRALEGSPVGHGLNWNNPATGRRGTVTPTRTFTSTSGENCREYQQTASAGGATEFAYATRCRRPDGRWVMVAGPYRVPPDRTRRLYPRYGDCYPWPYGYDPHYPWRYYYPRCPL